MPEVFKRVATRQMSWRDYMVATEGELASELRWGRARSGNQHATTFEECLLPSETVRLTIFRDKHDVGTCVCNLSQNPEFTRAAGRDMELHTLVRNSVVLWSCEHRRWLTGREMLLANEFPVLDAHLDAICGVTSKHTICSFNESRIVRGLSARDRVHMAHQSGNSQNINAVGAVLQWLFLFVETSPLAVALPMKHLGTLRPSASFGASFGASPLQKWKDALEASQSITPDPKRRRRTQDLSGAIALCGQSPQRNSHMTFSEWNAARNACCN